MAFPCVWKMKIRNNKHTSNDYFELWSMLSGWWQVSLKVASAKVVKGADHFHSSSSLLFLPHLGTYVPTREWECCLEMRYYWFHAEILWLVLVAPLCCTSTCVYVALWDIFYSRITNMFPISMLCNKTKYMLRPKDRPKERPKKTPSEVPIQDNSMPRFYD